MGDEPVGVRRASGPGAKKNQSDRGGGHEFPAAENSTDCCILHTLVLLFLFYILVWRWRGSSEQWNTFLVGDPRMGHETFQQKGCSGCHSVLGAGAKLAPDLGLQGAAGSSMNELVTQMWNHAPRMWKQLKVSHVSFPQFTPEEMANLFAYLYVTCYDDESGNRARGEVLFTQKGASAAIPSAK